MLFLPGHPVTVASVPASEKKETRKNKGNKSLKFLATKYIPEPQNQSLFISYSQNAVDETQFLTTAK